MNRFRQTLTCTLLALAAGTVSYVSAADERTARSAQWAEAAARQAQEAQRRQREARLRWAYERRRSAAHARMPNTLYASTPSAPAHMDLSCPVLVDDDTRRLYRDSPKGQGPSSRILRAPDLFRSGSSSTPSSSSGVRVYSARGPGTANTSPWSSKPTPSGGAASHRIQASGWAAASVQSKSGTDSTHHVYLVPSASEPLRQGFVRVINHSAEAGEVSIGPVDDGGRAFDTITLSIDANETVHFNSGDLENGNEGKGLTGSTGSGEGDWRLEFTSDLDIEVLSYIRTTDGFLTAMHDVAPVDGNVHQVAIFNPGSNRNQMSRLRLINPTDATAEVTIRGTDDKGMPGSGEVSLSLDAGTAREITAEQLESGGTGLAGMLGDGSGKWRLQVESEQAVVAMSLLESPTDHLTNLSTVPELPEDGVHGVPLFPAAGDDSGRQGFVRAINRSDTAGEIHIKAYDETERDYEPVMLTIGANEVVHFNSDDLEQGSPQKGLSGGTGAGEGDWRLELTSDLQIEVLSYIRTTDGFLTAMHDVAPSAGNRHRVAVFNPGSNRNQESLLRLVNPGEETAEVTITGIDGNGAPGASAVSLSVPGGSSRTVGAWDLESGADGLDGALGDGAGKWQLMIDADRAVMAMSLLRSPTGHLTNLSTAPVRGARGGAIGEPGTAEAVFRQLISGPVVQSKCITCHVNGGASGNTRLVFVTDENPDHETINLQVFEDFLNEEEDGARYILNKIQGALGHGGGIQVAAGTDEYAIIEKFLTLLGEDVGPNALTPDTLFDGVTMESARSTLRRAAIIFSGRIPTEEEYESIGTGGAASLRAALRRLMQGPEFHEFLIRGSNDRLLTDRDGTIIDAAATDEFVDFSNLYYDKTSGGVPDSEIQYWYNAVQHGIRRAPLELIASVVENDLPYTEILTAYYIMANPMAAEAYGAQTRYDDPVDALEFKPSEIVSYYRDGPSKIADYSFQLGTQVTNPGELSTDYPHAGILNTTVFLARYPTTPTNRNRARSRWTYYHFLGLDIEKSASRTTDPIALADTNNPTMHNPACTVCHTVLDPVAGAFQNYGNDGLYRNQWGGMDSLDEQYKEGLQTRQIAMINARDWEDKETVTVRAWLPKGRNTIALATRSSHNIHVDYLTVLGPDGTNIAHKELEDSSDEECGSTRTGNTYELIHCPLVVPVEVPQDGEYEIETDAYVGYDYDEEPGRAATLAIWAPYDLVYQEGDTWYRDMRKPGLDGELALKPDNSLQWLAERVVADERFAEAAVKFWWPAVMGGDVVEPPSDQQDVDFEGRLLASNAQATEVARLAREFKRGFHGGSPYNLKDLLVELVLSNWFRTDGLSGDDPVRKTALQGAGAKRLLTPEELARKTAALTGFEWGRGSEIWSWKGPEATHYSALTDDAKYRLLYGGIDSDGITERARDINSVMAAVAKSHALESSCPIVLKELYLLPDNKRRLFSGIEHTTTPAFEFGTAFEIEAATEDEKETLSLGGSLSAGPANVRLSFTNATFDEETGQYRKVRVDRLDVRDESGDVVFSQELEDLDPVGEHNGPYGNFFWLHVGGSLDVPMAVPGDGSYSVDVIAWADQAGDELARLAVLVESDTESSRGAETIRNKLVDLHDRILGVQVDAESAEIESAYRLFVEVWERKREADNYSDTLCDWGTDLGFLDGILDDAVVRVDEDWGWYLAWDWDRVSEFMNNVEGQDPHGVAATWEVVLAFLMMDYHYLYL